MHPLLFSFKRVFLRSTRIVWPLAKEFGFTPARYDMLVAIARSPDGIAQLRLRHVLGVSAPVVCRMLRQLEHLDLVWRHPHPLNEQWRWVRLTDAARDALAEASSELEGPDSLLDAFVHAAVTRRPESLPERRLGYAAASGVTDVLRERLGDRATLRYPGYPAPGEPWPSSVLMLAPSATPPTPPTPPTT